MTDMTPTLPPLGPLPEPHRKSGQQMSYDGWDKAHFDCFDPVQMQSYATAYGAECARASVPAGFVLFPKKLTAAIAEVIDNDEWNWEDLLAAANSITSEEYEEIAATPPAVEARVPAVTDEMVEMALKAAFLHSTRENRKDMRRALEMVFSSQSWLSAAPAAPKPLFGDMIAQHEGLAEELAAPQADPQGVPEPVATLLDFDMRSQIGTVDLHGEWMDLRVGDKLFATQPPTQQASEQPSAEPEQVIGLDKENQTMKLMGFIDDLIEADPDRAERFIESVLAKAALRKRLEAKKAAEPAPQQASAQGEQE